MIFNTTSYYFTDGTVKIKGSDLYLFENGDKKYLLVSVDYTGDYEFDVFPHLLKFEGDKLEFVLQREIPIKDSYSREETSNTILFEYTD